MTEPGWDVIISPHSHKDPWVMMLSAGWLSHPRLPARLSCVLVSIYCKGLNPLFQEGTISDLDISAMNNAISVFMMTWPAILLSHLNIMSLWVCDQPINWLSQLTVPSVWSAIWLSHQCDQLSYWASWPSHQWDQRYLTELADRPISVTSCLTEPADLP